MSRHIKPDSPWWHLYVPKSVAVLKRGYSWAMFREDFIAGLTVAIVALPLAMALAIASGTTPDKGLITVVVAGLLISLLGGSRFQIGGPTGAFVVVVFNVIAQHGYDGLVLATFMAGAMLAVAGLARFGDWIKYMPQPVVTGFTAGIAVILMSSQVRDFFGLHIDKVPGDFIAKWEAFWQARETFAPDALVIAALSLGIILALRRFAPKLPAFLIAILAASGAVFVLHLPIQTIGTMFGGIPRTLPAPHLPAISLGRMQELLPSAFTIAFLAGVESLLSAVVADGMTGRRHRSNCELVAQGVANFASALFGGMPATGAIARTATNIRAGGKTPVAGILHAVFVLLIMMAAAPLASYIPLASLAAVLVIVAWNMLELDKFRMLMKGPVGDRLVLLTTFGLTVAVDLTKAIETGVVLAAILFMHRMSEAVEMQAHVALFEGDREDMSGSRGDDMRAALPSGVEAYRVQGPLFFGVSSRLIDVLDQISPAPKVFILRLSQCPMIDSSGATALHEFIRRCQVHKTIVILSGVAPKLMKVLHAMDLHNIHYSPTFRAALKEAERLTAAREAG